MKSNIVKNTLAQNLLLILMVINAFYVPISSAMGQVFVKGYQYMLLLVVVLFALKHISEISRNRLVLWQFILVLLFSVAFFGFSDAESTTQYKCLLYTLLVFPTFYTESFNENSITISFCLIIIGLLFSFYFNLSVLRIENENAYGGGYLPLVAYALGLYLCRGKNQKYVIVWSLISMFFILISAKRGDILAFILGFIVYFFYALKDSGSFAKSFFIFALVVGLGYVLFQYVLSSSEILSIRVQQTKEGNSSDREIIYSGLLYFFFHTATLTECIFGSGFNATVGIVGIVAHSDFLESLIDIGVVGLIIYLACMLSLYKQTKYAIPSNRPILFVVLSIWLVKALFSMFIYDGSTLFLFMLCGLLLNKNNTNNDTVQQ